MSSYSSDDVSASMLSAWTCLRFKRVICSYGNNKFLKMFLTFEFFFIKSKCHYFNSWRYSNNNYWDFFLAYYHRKLKACSPSVSFWQRNNHVGFSFKTQNCIKYKIISYGGGRGSGYSPLGPLLATPLHAHDYVGIYQEYINVKGTERWAEKLFISYNIFIYYYF